MFRALLVGCVPFLSLACLAQSAALPPGCGDAATQYKVKTQKQAFNATADPAKARIVFVETLEGGFAGGPIVRFGVDGAWVGADKGASWTAVDVAPGTHHLCASRQSNIRLERDNVGAATLNARAGETYFVNFRIVRTEIGSPEMAVGTPGSSMASKQRDTMDSAEFKAVQADAALKLLAKLPQSTATVK